MPDSFDANDEERLVLVDQRLKSVDFGDRVLAQFSSDGCSFIGCRFDNVEIGSAAFGAGQRVSEYVNCSFDNAILRMGPGGYARFIDCSFEGAVIEQWVCYAVDVVDCSFSGRLRKVVFNGAVPASKQHAANKSTNRFEGNDFARASLVDVGFRTGIDLAKQKLPTGDGLYLLKDAEASAVRARRAFDSFHNRDLARRAGGVLSVIEKGVAEGQQQLFIRVDDYPRADRAAVRLLLEAAKTV